MIMNKEIESILHDQTDFFSLIGWTMLVFLIVAIATLVIIDEYYLKINRKHDPIKEKYKTNSLFFIFILWLLSIFYIGQKEDSESYEKIITLNSYFIIDLKDRNEIDNFITLSLKDKELSIYEWSRIKDLYIDILDPDESEKKRISGDPNDAKNIIIENFKIRGN